MRFYLSCNSGCGTEDGVATELVPQSPPLMSVHPTEEAGKLGGGGAACKAVRPIFGESVVFGSGFKAARAYGELHGDIGAGGLGVVAPEGG